MQLVFALLLSGCGIAGYASGKINYSGQDPLGPFSDNSGVQYCSAHFQADGKLTLWMRLVNPSGMLFLDDAEQGRIGIRIKQSEWDIAKENCSTYDFQKFFDANKNLHVTVSFDCTTLENKAHVWGRAATESCYFQRP